MAGALLLVVVLHGVEVVVLALLGRLVRRVVSSLLGSLVRGVVRGLLRGVVRGGGLLRLATLAVAASATPPATPSATHPAAAVAAAPGVIVRVVRGGAAARAVATRHAGVC